MPLDDATDLRADPRNILPGDPRYDELARRSFNRRVMGRPDYVRLVGTTQDVVDAVQEAVSAKRRVVARSGGHCLESFVTDPDVRVVIDTTLMTRVSFDPAMRAFAIEPGATLGDAYRALYLGWGVVLPAGESPDVGVGGHVLGGAFGFLCRLHGLAVDYLHAVEVVTVDASGTARAVVATRDPSDPHHDLWWAHTGGGGGNFGIVTRYWFRDPRADGDDPTALMPRAPRRVLSLEASWDWNDLDEARFARLTRNFGEWSARHAAVDAPDPDLCGLLSLNRKLLGTIDLRAVLVDETDVERRADAFVAAIADGVGMPTPRVRSSMSWLAFARDPWPSLYQSGPGGVAASGGTFKIKDALRREPYTDAQIATLYDYLTRDVAVGGNAGMATYGGRTNAIAPNVTAVSQRRAIMDTACSAGWGDASGEADALRWVRELYRDLFAESGGVPVPNDQNDGSLINHPDVDMADPAWNTSGVPWQTIYYQGNYARLQRVKAAYDPTNVFRHALSIAPASE